jgi:hypothetical protein
MLLLRGKKLAESEANAMDTWLKSNKTTFIEAPGTHWTSV